MTIGMLQKGSFSRTPTRGSDMRLCRSLPIVPLPCTNAEGFHGARNALALRTTCVLPTAVRARTIVSIFRRNRISIPSRASYDLPFIGRSVSTCVRHLLYTTAVPYCLRAAMMRSQHEITQGNTFDRVDSFFSLYLVLMTQRHNNYL